MVGWISRVNEWSYLWSYGCLFWGRWQNASTIKIPFTHWAKYGHSITVFVYLIYIVILFCLFCLLLLFVCLFVCYFFCLFCYAWCFFDWVVVYYSTCLYCYHFNIFCRLSRSSQCQWEFPRRIYFVLLLELSAEILIKCSGFIKYFIYY